MASLLTAVGLLLPALLAFVVLRIVYRLTLHPLAGFPGPKIAAITSLYQAWYDLSPSTSFVKHFPVLHQKYGPIVRTTPNGIQVFDMSAYNEIFKAGSRFSKHPDFYSQQITKGMFNVLDPRVAKHWRDPYQPYFSKSAMLRLEPLIYNRVNKFLDLLKTAARDKTPADLTLGYRCLTSDVVMSYIFADTGFESLDVEGFRSPILIAMEDFFQTHQWTMYFHNFMKWVADNVLMRLPVEYARRAVPALGAALWIQEACGAKVEKIMADGGSGNSYHTVFDAWAKPELSEKRTFIPNHAQLTSDAAVFHGAGTDTTASALMMGTWHLLNNEEYLMKLRDEVKKAILNSKDDGPLSMSTLENLPYLRAVVKETLRTNVGVPGKIPRVVPEGGTILCGRNVPAGTAIMSAAYCYHYDPQYFPNPEKFNPDRWLQPNAGELESRLVTFSRGPRACLGINLAYAELYLTLASVISKFDMTLFETTAEDMEWKDNFVITTKGHLKVLLKEVSKEA